MKSGIRFDHVALLVRDLKQSVADYQQILGVLDSENSVDVVWESGEEGGHSYEAATFVSKNGQTVIQLLQSNHPNDQARLQKNGQCVHHFEFCTNDVEGTGQKLKDASIPLTTEAPSISKSMPWQKSFLISPKKTHGVLVKIASAYKVKNGKWIPEE